MSTWKSDAVTVDYDTLMETPYEYIDLPFTVKGTVEAIYEDSNNHTDIKLKDDDGNVYLFIISQKVSIILHLPIYLFFLKVTD